MTKIANERDVPLSIILLILCVVCYDFVSYIYLLLTLIIKIEHALKEWENGKKAHKSAFSEDSVKHRLDL